MIKKGLNKITAAAVAAAMTFSMGCSANRTVGKSADESPDKSSENSSVNANKLDVPLRDPSKAAAGSRPNIVLIYADDLGFGNTNLSDPKAINTPNIYSIAENGVLMTQGYVVSPICAPSRAGLLTSIHPVRMGGDNNYSARTNVSQVPNTTIASLLKEKGYSTMAIGKWDVGTTPELMPDKRGFEGFFGFPNGISSYYQTGPNRVPADGWHLDKKGNAVKGGTLSYKRALDIREYNPETKKYSLVMEKEYLTDAFTREALEFIDKEAADPDPFFLYLAYNAPHGPQQAPDDHVKKFSNITNDKTRLFAASVDAMDEQIGKVLQKLDEKGLTKNTMVIFASDNGPDVAGNSGGLKGRKHDVFEGGIRVPFAVQWPEQYDKNTKFDKLVTTMDILPTIVSAAGYDVNELKKKYSIEGVDITPYIQGKAAGSTHDAFFWRQVDDYTMDLEMAVRAGDYKYVSVVNTNGKKTEYLFNIALDPRELNNLVSKPENKDIYEDLKSKLEKWHSEIPMSENLGDGKGDGEDE